MFDLERKLQQLDSRLSNIFRVGTVTSLKPGEHKARVVFEDRDELESFDLLVLVKNTQENKDYAMPDINEQVLCCFLPIGLEQGFIVGSYYTKANAPTESTEAKRVTEYKDGTRIEYDRDAHQLDITIPEAGAVNINVNGKATIKAKEIDLGESALQPVVLGDNLAQWVKNELKDWLDTHHHGGPPPVTPFDEGEAATGGNVYSTKNKTQ